MLFRSTVGRACVYLLASASFVCAQATGPQTLLEGSAAGVEKRVTPTKQVSVAKDDKGVVVNIEAGEEGYPGVSVVPDGAPSWDLSGFGAVEVTLSNLTDKPLTVTIRIDDPSDWKLNPWNGENVSLKANETKAGKVYFGYSWGKPGYAIKSGEITKVMAFTGKVKEAKSFRIDSIKAVGKPGDGPPVDEKSIRIVPKDGVMLGSGVKLDPKQLAAKNTETKANDDGSIAVTFPAGKKDRSITVAPPKGRWDLRQSLQVSTTVRNASSEPVAPRLRVSSNGGPTDLVTADAVAPGASKTVTVEFIPKQPWVGPKEIGKLYSEQMRGTGSTKFQSDVVSGVVVSLDDSAPAASLVIESIKAEVGEPAQLPDWLGKRPPVEGDWTMTFEDNFDGSEIDTKKWNYYAANYWDKRTHFSKANTFVEGGFAKLRFEKKTGPHNDVEGGPTTDYATGFLDTYGKWVQRYGYFESRMKLPKAPGLWPAFWMMPDRGLDAGPQWKRQDTKNGGMEFDIVEQLTRWGPFRYNVAMHWDGYDKQHNATGSTNVYFRPDKDGFITAGLLWLPGKAVFYANGVEIGRWEHERVCSVESNLMFTLPSGGWDNNALDDKQLPDDYVIDYVRCWQLKEHASDKDGVRQPAPGNELGRDRK